MLYFKENINFVLFKGDVSPKKCPTITMSAVLYNCWKTLDNSMGNAKMSS